MLAGPNDRSDVEKGGKSMYLFSLTRSPSRLGGPGAGPRSQPGCAELLGKEPSVLRDEGGEREPGRAVSRRVRARP